MCSVPGYLPLRAMPVTFKKKKNCIFPLYFALSEDECVYFCKNVWLEFALLRNVNVTYMPRLFFSETFSFEGERKANNTSYG